MGHHPAEGLHRHGTAPHPSAPGGGAPGDRAAGAINFWYAGPAIMNQLHAGAWLGSGIRIVRIGLVASWLVRTLASAGMGTAAPDRNAG